MYLLDTNAQALVAGDVLAELSLHGKLIGRKTC